MINSSQVAVLNLDQHCILIGQAPSVGLTVACSDTSMGLTVKEWVPIVFAFVAFLVVEFVEFCYGSLICDQSAQVLTI